MSWSWPRIIFDECLNSLKYIDLLEEYLPTTLERFPNNELNNIIYQQDNARAHLSKMTQDFFEKNNIKQLKCPANSADLNIIENLRSILENIPPRFSTNNLDDLKRGIENGWREISADPLEKSFNQCQSEFNMELILKAFHVTISDLFKKWFRSFSK